MGNSKEKYKRQFSEEDDSNYYADKEDDERRHDMSSSSKRFKSPRKRNSRSRSRSTRQDKRLPRSWSKSPKRDTKSDESRYKYTSEYYCRDCNVYASGLATWQQHLAGKRHAFNKDREKRVEPCQDSFKKRKSAEKETYWKENNSMNKKRKLGEEPSHEKNNYVGLTYVLVIHKQGKSVFQCFLCDTCTVYHNSKQLTDHVLGDKHQKAYVEQHGKGLIKIKRLKSRNPGKGLLEEFIEQKLFHPNKTETNTKPKIETSTLGKYRDSQSSCDKKRSFASSKKNHSSTSGAKKHNFLRKFVEQVHLYNRRYELKLTSTTAFVPERFSSTTPQSVSSTAQGDSTPPIYAPSPNSPASENGTIVLSDDDENYGPIPSSSHSTKAVVPDISKLAVALTPIEVFNLVLLKLKNGELSKEDIQYLYKVAYETTVLSKKFKEDNLNSIQRMEKDVNGELNNEVVKDNAIRTEQTLINEESVMESTMENVDQNSSIVLPDSVWNSLYGIRSSFPDLNSLKD